MKDHIFSPLFVDQWRQSVLVSLAAKTGPLWWSTPFGRGHKQDIAGRVVARTSGRHISKARLPQLCCVVLCLVISGVDRSGTQIIHGNIGKLLTLFYTTDNGRAF